MAEGDADGPSRVEDEIAVFEPAGELETDVPKISLRDACRIGLETWMGEHRLEEAVQLVHGHAARLGESQRLADHVDQRHDEVVEAELGAIGDGGLGAEVGDGGTPALEERPAALGYFRRAGDQRDELARRSGDVPFAVDP